MRLADCANGCRSCADCCDCDELETLRQARLRQRAWLLTVLTIAWNAIEAIVGTIGGILASSVALLGYGLDSLVEVSSAVVVTWRLAHRLEGEEEERAERTAARLVAVSLGAVGCYVAFGALSDLVTREEPGRSP